MNRRSANLIFLFISLIFLTLLVGGGANVDRQDLARLESLTAGGGQEFQQTPVRIGEVEPADLNFNYLDPSTWRQVIQYPGAAYIKLHLAQLDLAPGDRFSISDPMGLHQYTYPGSGTTRGDSGDIWALSIPGDTAVVELLPTENTKNALQATASDLTNGDLFKSETAVVIDKFARGYGQEGLPGVLPLSTCGTNERTDVACYQNSHPAQFNNSRPVVRILKNGLSHCTGWRVSSNNLLLTNEHCITSQNELDQVEFWFNYQRPACENGDPNAAVTIVPGETFLLDDYALDFALVTLKFFDQVEQYGYLDVDPRTPILGEEIYIPQHGAGNPKEFGIESDLNQPGGFCQIDDAVRDGRGLNTDTGYYCDTIGGSSGSPVLASSSHRVIGLHHFGINNGQVCGGSIMNGAVRMDRIYPLIEEYLPPLAADFSLEVTPGTKIVCVPTPAVYEVSVGEFLDFSEPVNLSVTGLPNNTSGSFSQNPVTPPGTSQLTVSTQNGAPGYYSFTVQGSSATKVHTTTAALELFTASPSSAGLINPANGQVGVDLQPVFTWSAANQGYKYIIEIAGDVNFSNILFQEELFEPTYSPPTLLAPQTQYYWRVKVVNPCGQSAWSSPSSFMTGEAPPILLVDDDDNDPDVRDAYVTALDTLVGADDYHIWDTGNSDNEPDADRLALYDAVIWFSGDEFGGAAGPGSAAEGALANWLNQSGCLFISSQDYFYDRGMTSFMSQYLGLAEGESDVGQLTVSGQPPVFSSLGPYDLQYPFSNYSDRLEPDSGSNVAFSGDEGNSAVSKQTESYRSTYWGFPWEAIASPGERILAMSAFLSWCGFTQNPVIDISPEEIIQPIILGEMKEISLTVKNVGADLLDWQLSENIGGGCGLVQDIPWVETTIENGSNYPGESATIGVTFQTAGYSKGGYTGSFCFSSNDTVYPLVEVPITMAIVDREAFLPLVAAR